MIKIPPLRLYLPSNCLDVSVVLFASWNSLLFFVAFHEQISALLSCRSILIARFIPCIIPNSNDLFASQSLSQSEGFSMGFTSPLFF